MIIEKNLERSIKARNPADKSTYFEKAQEYRQRADERINLYLTRFVKSKMADKKIYSDAIRDYENAALAFKNAGARKSQVEALLAYGNAIKESFVPSSSMEKSNYASCKVETVNLYKKAFEGAKGAEYNQYGQFTRLEQMNLEARTTSWRLGKNPRRIAVFHTTLSSRSQIFLKGVYYYALRNGIEIWEYSEGRSPDSADTRLFLKDRILDCCGIVFLASAEYTPENDHIEFEINASNILQSTGDPIEVFALDLDAKRELMKKISPKVPPQKEEHFENNFSDFLQALPDIYECREHRLNNDDLWKELHCAGLKKEEF